MHMLAVEDAMCGMRRMCWILYTITYHPALITFLLQQEDFLREQYGVLYVRISCILLLMYNQYKMLRKWAHSLSLRSLQPYINPSTSQHHHFSPEDGDSMFLQNVGIY
jgi:hypothetical protein